jgi:hypothetical protein
LACRGFILDGLVKSLFGPIFVIPAKAGIHPAEGGTAFAGVTASPTFYEFIILYSSQKTCLDSAFHQEGSGMKSPPSADSIGKPQMQAE